MSRASLLLFVALEVTASGRAYAAEAFLAGSGEATRAPRREHQRQPGGGKLPRQDKAVFVLALAAGGWLPCREGRSTPALLLQE